MRGKVIRLVAVVLALLVLATPGLVAARGGNGGGGHGGASFTLLGTIDAKGTDAPTIDVLVDKPSSLYDEVITVLTTADTRFKQCDYVTSFRIDFDGLVVGRDVKVAGTVIDGTYVASSVIQYYVPPPEE